MDWTRYDAALFDLDGVVTPTAEVHMRAWATMFNEFLHSRGVNEVYTDADYYAHVDGMPRYDGVRSFLASRGITVPEGDPGDDPAVESIAGLGNRKNDAFNEVLRHEGVTAYPGSVMLIEHLAQRGIAMAIVSSSRNAPAVLEAAGLAEHFATVMHGGVAAERGLPGKPAPDTFLAAAADLGVAAADCVVLEDAVSGVSAGAAGDFGLVVGVDRGAGVDALTEAGADVVVADLMELLPTPGEETP